MRIQRYYKVISIVKKKLNKNERYNEQQRTI